MLGTFRKLAGDEAGFIISAELVLVMTLGVLGMVVGLAAIRDAVTSELNDVAQAFGAVSQTYHVAGLTKYCNDWSVRDSHRNNWSAHASVSGFGFNDYADECDLNPIRYIDVYRKNDSFRRDDD